MEAAMKDATIIAGKIMGRNGIPRIDNLQFQDTCPLSIGLRSDGDRMKVIIPAGTKFPATATKRMRIQHQSQTRKLVQVYEGPWYMTKRNALLAECVVEVKSPAGQNEQIYCAFNLDSNRILMVAVIAVFQRTRTDLKVTKNTCRVDTRESERVQFQREVDRTDDVREWQEATRRSAVQMLAMNLNNFFKAETTKGSNPISGRAFVETIPKANQRQLLAFVRSRVPGEAHGVRTWEEVGEVFKDIQTELSSYLSENATPIPKWLERPAEDSIPRLSPP
jgi:molecular chaperone DnaK (HSP70)